MNTLTTITQRLLRFRDERDWSQFHKPKDLACAIAIESGELLEIFLWKNPEEISAFLNSKQGRDELEGEMADILIYLILLAQATDTDLLAATSSKIEINEKRYPIEKHRGNSKKSSR